jgi:hypothetical protein
VIATLNGQVSSMLGIPRRYARFMFGVIQSGLTSAITAAITSVNLLNEGVFLRRLLQSWLVAWILMLPVVVLAAPLIRRISLLLTRPDAM